MGYTTSRQFQEMMRETIRGRPDPRFSDPQSELYDPIFDDYPCEENGDLFEAHPIGRHGGKMAVRSSGPEVEEKPW